MENHTKIVYNISCKSVMVVKPLYVMLDKIDEFIIVYDGTRYLVLFRSGKYVFIYHRIRYVIKVKSGIT